MAFYRGVLFAVLLLVVISQDSTEAAAKGNQAVAVMDSDSTSIPKINCTEACGVRCQKHGRPNLCLRACGTCCYRCNCVPSGQSGNREECGSCYTDMTTHNNRTKCP